MIKRGLDGGVCRSPSKCSVVFYLVFLFRSAYLVVEFGMMERQAAVHSKRLECFLVLLQEYWPDFQVVLKQEILGLKRYISDYVDEDSRNIRSKCED
jgi:hypothetical protein